ncbi:diguanylate cyclase [Desulfurobacterium sp.]
MKYKKLKRSFVRKTLFMIMALIAFSALISAFSDFFVIKKIESEIKKKEARRIERAFPPLLHLCEQKIGNMLNSFGMWNDMVYNVEVGNVDWIKEMFEDDQMVVSQFDSYGVFNAKGEPVYVKNAIFSAKNVAEILGYISRHFNDKKFAEPVTFFHRWKGKIYHVGVLPLCWNDGRVASKGFIYFAHESSNATLSMYSHILSTRISLSFNGVGPDARRIKSSDLIYVFPMKDIDNSTVGFLRFYEDTLVINVFREMNKVFIVVFVTILIAYAAASFFVATSVNKAMKETFGSITSSLRKLSEGDFNAINELDQFCRRKDELGSLAKNIKKIAKQLSVNLSTDPLTGVYNRLYFSRKFEEEIERARRSKRPLSFAIFDLDDFKKINDTYGHVAGDAVLKHFAEAVSSEVRNIDTFARIGGEEFGLILPEANQEAAYQVVRRIKKKLKNIYIPDIGRKIRVTFSAGIASFKDGDNVDSLFHRADVALYKAKERGKNRIELEGEESEGEEEISDNKGRH